MGALVGDLVGVFVGLGVGAKHTWQKGPGGLAVKSGI